MRGRSHTSGVDGADKVSFAMHWHLHVFDMPWGPVALAVPSDQTMIVLARLVERNAPKLAQQTKHKKDMYGDPIETGVHPPTHSLGWRLNVLPRP